MQKLNFNFSKSFIKKKNHMGEATFSPKSKLQKENMCNLTHLIPSTPFQI
jgi:hypothetical protein